MPSRISDAYRAHPVDLHRNLPDFTSLQELPDSYKWNHQFDDYPSTPVVDSSLVSESVPVIDLNEPNALQLIGHACKSWGVFQVINHGIPTSILQQTESTAKTLFSLPLQQKLKASRSPDAVSGYGLARISPFFSKLMWYEGFTVFGSPLHHFRQLWPQDYTKHCDVMEGYEKEMKKLAAKLMWLILGSLGISKEDVQWAGPKGDFADAFPVSQLNYYPACPDPDKAMGLAAHTDSTILTILYQNSISGLQVMKEGVGWVTVPPISGGLVINVGDLLHILSNGIYRSVLHRAMVNRTKNRISIACLYGPPANVQISPLRKLVSPSQPPLYRAITWSEYLGTKAKYFNQALSSVRICSPLHGLANVNDHNDNVEVG
ncbi:gibberellin 3-beta-dioxygenase 1-like [Mangifera indica]|uniref:gibberellin 3-beta-dioxygenase 1-like n=1 Tax=Mangifera indica TaxID=29780 RepID=UPI001CF9A812|nr:gibberellin 3-beta-dioxygenase 1-like [Mangifera indica]